MLRGWFLLIGLLVTTTTVRADFADRSPARAPQPRRVIPLDMSDLATPFDYPIGEIQQRHRWRDGAPEWRLNVLSERAKWCGFYLRRPIQPVPDPDQTVLYFTLRPASAAAHLALGLLDGAHQPPNIKVVPVSAYAVPQQAADSGVLAVAIPLSAFAAERALRWRTLRGVFLQLSGDLGAGFRRLTVDELQVMPRSLAEQRWGLAP